MSKNILKTAMNVSVLTVGFCFIIPSYSMGMYGLTQEQADKEFGKMRAQGNGITITQPRPDPKPATDEEYKKFEQELNREINKKRK